MPIETEAKFPRVVAINDVANQYFGDGLFKIKGGRAVYDEVWIADGGTAAYLIRLVPGRTNKDPIKILRRWIPWTTVIIMTYDPQDDYK